MPRFDYLFVVTYGRSGSTLLQHILNSIPGYLIRGENGGALVHLYRFHSTCRAKSRRFGHSAGDATSPWFGIDGYPSRPALRTIRGLVESTLLRPEASTRVAGFKEIRWSASDGIDDLDDYLAWMGRVFPGARFIVNTRDLDAVAASGWWRDDPDARPHLEALHDQLLSCVGRLGDRGFATTYEQLTSGPEGSAPLLAWLGEPYDAEAIAAVLKAAHEYRGRQSADEAPEPRLSG